MYSMNHFAWKIEAIRNTCALRAISWPLYVRGSHCDLPLELCIPPDCEELRMVPFFFLFYSLCIQPNQKDKRSIPNVVMIVVFWFYTDNPPPKSFQLWCYFWKCQSCVIMWMGKSGAFFFFCFFFPSSDAGWQVIGSAGKHFSCFSARKEGAVPSIFTWAWTEKNVGLDLHWWRTSTINFRLE